MKTNKVIAFGMLTLIAACRSPEPNEAGVDKDASGTRDVVQPIDVPPRDEGPQLDVSTLDTATTDAGMDVPTIDTGTDATTMDVGMDVPTMDAGMDVPLIDTPIVSDGSVIMDATTDSATCMGASCGAPQRLLAPASQSTTRQRRPTFRWIASPGATSTRVEVCRDRACTMVITQMMGQSTATPSIDLPKGVVYWRAFSRFGTTESAASATWQFTVGMPMTHDVDGDGFDDVAVGVPNATVQSMTNAGKVAFYRGQSSGFPSSPTLVLDGPAASANFGTSVAFNDVNGDGYADLIVGDNTWRVRVYLGSATGLSSTASSTILTADATDASLAFALIATSAGDVNGDGFGDVAVALPRQSADANLYAGAVKVYLGSATGLSATPQVSLYRANLPYDHPSLPLRSDFRRFGISVSSAGDVNGDGYSDIVVGNSSRPAPGMDAPGNALVYLGSPTGTLSTPQIDIAGSGYPENLGYSVSGAGDVNGDGFSDIIVGAWQATVSSSQPFSGTATVYLGSATGITLTSPTVLSRTTTSGFGFDVGGVGDVNGDGFSDVATNNGLGQNQANLRTFRVYLGGSAGVVTTSPKEVPLSQYGLGRVWELGDINGDGYADFSITVAKEEVGGVLEAGKLWIYVGDPAATLVPALIELSGARGYGLFGASVASLFPWVPVDHNHAMPLGSTHSLRFNS